MTTIAQPIHAAEVASDPRVLDTYSLSYALILAFLLPGVALMARLPFGDSRSTTYSPAYVSLVTVPFLLGLVVTFLLDNRDGLKRALLRIAVLTPLVVVTGVTFMFGFSMIMIPASKFLGIRDQGLSIAWWVGLIVAAAPLVFSLRHRIAERDGWRSVVSALALLVALALVIGLAAFSFLSDANIYSLVRKDVVIYIVGALSWYLPSFGLAAGLWRASGIV